MAENWDWVEKREEEIKEERDKGYLKIVEGDQRFVLLSHCAPLAQVYDPSTKKYRAAVEGDKNVSVKGLCWVMQENMVKEAKLPYTVVKSIRALQQNADWEFKIPFNHPLTLNAKGAGSKEVVYTLTASPKTIEIPAAILQELKTKPSPEEMVEKIKGGKRQEEDTREAPPPTEMPDNIDLDSIPF